MESSGTFQQDQLVFKVFPYPRLHELLGGTKKTLFGDSKQILAGLDITPDTNQTLYTTLLHHPRHFLVKRLRGYPRLKDIRKDHGFFQRAFHLSLLLKIERYFYGVDVGVITIVY